MTQISPNLANFQSQEEKKHIPNLYELCGNKYSNTQFNNAQYLGVEVDKNLVLFLSRDISEKNGSSETLLKKNNLSLKSIFDEKLNINKFGKKLAYSVTKLVNSSPVSLIILNRKGGSSKIPNPIESDSPFVGQELKFYSLDEGKLKIGQSVVTDSSIALTNFRGFQIYGPQASDLDPEVYNSDKAQKIKFNKIEEEITSKNLALAFTKHNTLMGLCYHPDRYSDHWNCIHAGDVGNYLRTDSPLLMSKDKINNQYPKFDMSKRSQSLKRRLGLSLKTASDQEGVFAFKIDKLDSVKTNVQMGDTIIGVNNGQCKNVNQFISLLGYGEEPVDLKIIRNGKQVDGKIEFD
jgi:hypothetical protein